ncbi:hypothetical protein [Spirosoma sordidisoli]|nr:hypothetical protein [Spirosoma sordidisoli]
MSAPSSSVDDLLFIYANQTVLLGQPRLLRRFDRASDRYYYTVEGSDMLENLAARFFISTTSFCKKVLPTSSFLIEWMKKQGENADAVRDLAADFGTLMHISFADFHQKGFDFRNTRQRVEGYLLGLGHSPRLIGEWTTRLNKCVASYAQFCYEYQVEPVLIEGMLASDELGIGGTVDLVAYLTIPKFGRVLAQVDFKSGGIYSSAELQLVINKLIFEENFPHLEIERMYSWAPKDFQKEPTYTLKDQGKTRFTPAVLDALLTVYQALYSTDMNKQYHEFDGLIKPGQPPADYHQVLGLSEVVLKAYQS